MIKQQFLEGLKVAAKDLGFPATDIVCTIPKNPVFGDYTTNLALQLANQIPADNYHSAEEIAKKILEKFERPNCLERVEIHKGFINFYISDKGLLKNTEGLDILPKAASPHKVFVEYGHVNLLKEVHIGHLRTFILGESISRVYEALGHRVFRANYQGDIGLHIAKAIWGIKQIGLPSKELTLAEKAKFLGQAYTQGNTAYSENPQAKQEIERINVSLYNKEPDLKEIYALTRAWSLEYFEPIYELLGIKYDQCFFESEVYEPGKKIVAENTGKVFIKNNGAIIFPGEKMGLHNRVFVTSLGNPTYEGKEIGLALKEYDSFNYDQAIHVVASEQEGYFQVVFKAIELLFPYLAGKKYHLSYGLVDLKEGKMSSRLGNVVTVNDLYQVVLEKVREIMKQSRIKVDQKTASEVALGAIKFSYLKFSPRPNMVFDLEESVSLEGDSGPYLQYTYARIQSVLRKAEKTAFQPEDSLTANLGLNYQFELEKAERMILRQLLYFPETVEQAAFLFHPNLLASYLINLARFYNLFYQGSRIIGSEKESFRLKLSLEAGKVLKKGLFLLGIEAVEKM